MNNEIDFVNIYVETLKSRLFESIAREVMTESKLVLSETRLKQLESEIEQLRIDYDKLQQKLLKKPKLADDQF